jgi:uncharacterized protein (DUF885 family)
MKSSLLHSLLATLCIVMMLLAPFDDVAAQRRRTNRRPAARRTTAFPQANQDARLAQIADAYLRGYYAFNPTTATALGLHEYDARLESRSAESIEREKARLRSALAELARVRETNLSASARYDYLVLQSHARAQLLELEEIRMWQRDPNIYNYTLAASVDNILKRNYAPIERRLDAVIARERESVRLLNEARQNLANPPRIYTEAAIEQTRGNIDFFARIVPQRIERAGGGRLSAARRAEFAAANDGVVSALRSFAEWLERDLLPRSNGDFRLGAENYRRKLLYEEMIDTPLAELLNAGERALRRTQEEMRSVAAEIAPGRTVAQVLQSLGREHPTASGLVGETRAELDRIRAFVRANNLLTPPAQENLIVAETPEYARAFSFASLDAPGAFERAATESYYYVTPPDPNWNQRRREEHLSFYNRYSLPIVSIHEAYPGHYYQLLAARNSSSRVRAVFGAASFIEGWAHYCEQMMLDEGFGGGNPRLRLAQLHSALRRLCRYVVGIRLHTAGMTYDEAVGFFMREGYEERANAEREARRGTIDPTYLVYTLGKMEILRLREDYRRSVGAENFRLGEFHDRLLSHGMPPVRILRMALLGDANNSNRIVNDETGQSSAVEFSVLATGTMSNYEGGRAIELITTQENWRRTWASLMSMSEGAASNLPDVNFNTRAVVLVRQGQKPTAGYGVSVAEIRRENQTLYVRVDERRPSPVELVAQIITSPFVAVSIPRPAENSIVRFADERSISPPTNQNRTAPQRRRRARRPIRRRG